MVRIGVASFAHMHAMSYAGWLNKMPNVQFVGISDESPVRGVECASRLAVPYYADPAELLRAGLDGIVICSENSRHLHWTELAAQAGVHILCEKPIATSARDGERMIALCQEAGVKLQMAFPCRFHSTTRRLKAIAAEGTLGRILAIKATNHGTMPGGWFVQKELSGGGAVIDHTVHVVDLIRWIFETEVESVYAEVGKLLHDELTVEDVGILSLKLSNGAVATLDSSWSRPRSFPTWGDVTMEVVGTAGTLSLDMFAQNIVEYRNSDNGAHWVNWGDDMDGALVADFVDMIESGRKPFISGMDGLRATEVAIAAYEAAGSGVTQTLRGE